VYGITRQGFGAAANPEGTVEALPQPMVTTFPAALLDRIGFIPYHPLSDDVFGAIIAAATRPDRPANE